MGQPQGSYINQSFAVSPAGVFSVSDDHGNSFSATVPLTANGVSTSTLVGNSTTAVLETKVSAGLQQLADVKLTFSVYKQFCQPAGVRLEIAGTETWGQSAQGTIKILFDKEPVSFSSYRAWFGNASGIALGFDWSDSVALKPAFDAVSSSVSYQVGSSFDIDPTTVGTSTGGATALSYQGHVFYANGLWWVFYFDGSHYGWKWSKDGLSWSSEQTISTGGLSVNGNLAVFVKGTTMYYAISDYSSKVYYRYGTLNPDGSISWGMPSEGSFKTTNRPYGGTSTIIDSKGDWWVAVDSVDSKSDTTIEAWECTTPSSCSWSLVGGGFIDSCSYSTCQGAVSEAQLVPLTNGKVSIVYQDYKDIGTDFRIKVYDSGWQGPAVTYVDDYLGQSACVAIGDTTECAFATYSQQVQYDSATSTPAWGSPVAIAESPTCSSQPSSAAISTDGNSQLAIEFSCAGWFYYSKSVNGGSTWTVAQGLSAGSSSSTTYLSMSTGFVGNLFAGVYTQGTSSPYNVDFEAVPFNIPTAALSSNSWSRPGLSPYESYFSEFSDYVSPGNGLVGVEEGTLDLPGRGLDLALSLVYSEPYAFRNSGSPYLYDNYTGANIGYGWSLNFPWLGTNYLHLSDGQAFPYSWNGNTFQYNGVTNFVLTKNAGGTYTLNMSSGTLYRFDTSQRLISITDRTGNNKISFSYGSNNYISQITDTIGRTITLSYNSNNQLTSISEGGRTWTLGYTGNQLTSLADPISTDPVTTFQYSGTSGANAWLLSAVLWPTTGEVTYAYSSAPVGTEVSTYYVTSRNVYYGSGLLSQSQSISSSLTNGQMVWSNSTISDGTTTREYLDYNFQYTPKSVMKIYAYDGTKTLQRITETDSDSSGRTNATKIYSPSGTLLAQSTFAYDNWGNLIYSKDNVGQQEWFSYANTNSANSFGSSGCSTSFYTQTISTNIHDLLVGACDYQNGSGTAQQQTYNEYATNGNLLEEKVSHNSAWLYTDYTYDSYGNVLTMTNANGTATYYRYSSTYSSAYLTKMSILVGTQNVTTTYTYNSNTGDMLSETDPNGQTTSYQYDALDRVTLITYPAVGGVSSTTSYTYYDNNNTMKIVDGDGHVTKEFFDGLARETEVERMNGSSVYSTQTFTYNWLNEVASNTTATDNTYTYAYDWDGSLIKVTNPDNTYVTTSYNYNNNTKTVTDENGHLTKYVYDWNQRLVLVKAYNGTTSYITTYSYDLSGNLLSVTDAKNQQTSYQYDDLNRLITTTFPTSPSTSETRTYDNLGNLLTLTTANNSQISYTYDRLGRLTKVTYPGSGGTVVYTYDADSNRLSMVNPSATYYYTYDAMDRLTNQTEYVGGVKYQTLYSYDKASNVVQLTYPDGYVLTMTYDAVNRLKTVGSFATVTYTVDNEISKITYGNGEVTTYTYDDRDRPTQILDKYGSTKELDLNYTYDGTGNVLDINTESYGYDSLNRLTSATGPWGTYTYAYDQTGNMIRQVQGSTTTVYCYGAYNRLSSYTTSSCSSPTVSYTYDANGNLISKTGGWTYSYNYANELTKVTYSGSTVQTNSYDGSGNRVKQTAGSSTYTYSYEGLSILYEKNVTGSTTTVTKHFYADGLQVAKMVGSTTYYLHEDALGNVRLEATSSVTITFSSNYVPYGSNYGVTGKEVFMYTGEPYNSVTGLYLFGARYYDPTIGRFITEDSYVGDDGDPMTLNRYIYSRDNPERYTDPSGHGLYGREFTDYNDASYQPGSTAIACDGGACTITNTDTYDGYTDSITTQFSTTTTTNTIATPSTTTTVVTSTTVFTTSVTNGKTNEIGGPPTTISGYVTSSSDAWTTSEPTIGTTTATASGSSNTNGQALFGLALLGGATVGLGLAFEPSLILTVPGFTSAVIYYFTSPDKTFNGELNAYAEGMHVVSSILEDLLPPIFP